MASVEALPGAHWLVGSQLHPQASVIVVPRAEFVDMRREEFSQSKSYVIVDAAWTPQSIKRALSFVRGALLMDSSLDNSEHLKVLQVALARQHEREQYSAMMQEMRTQNKRILEMNTQLEQLVLERTNTAGDSRKASQRNVAQVRRIIGFIKEISSVLEIRDMLPVIRRAVKEYHQLQPPILFVPHGEGFGDFYYLRGSQVIRANKRGRWESSPRIRINDPVDRHFLADALGRPFGKVLRFPLLTGRHKMEPARSPLLFFEFDLGVHAMEELVSTLSETLQPVSWALDRLVLEQELKSTSRDWEMTFDGLSEPIAILDKAGNILRANTHWPKEFTQELPPEGEQLRVLDQLFVVEKYPIQMELQLEPISWVVYLRDETRSQKLKSHSVHVEKMSAIGQLAGHIAHELNNPLTGIRSLTQVLLTETAGQLQQDLTEVERAAGRCQSIITNLLEFSKGDLDHKVQVVDLNEITMRTLPFLKSATGRFRNDIRLTSQELWVKVEPQLMQQVIFNLINNACQAMSEVGELVVQTEQTAKWAVLEVRDTGPGIDRALREKIFEPFFTTKVDGEGTGLGLSLSRDFVRQFGGELECESELGMGSVFRVRLPLGVEA